ncbi:exopolysaccharide biosynthesis protein [Acuticoccus sediminis]|nr:exopolysaccharide biosynthesis protein [Acuticoccus sediminis]
MAETGTTGRLQTILDDICEMGQRGGKVSVAQILDCVGRTSFAAVLLVPSLIVVSPLSAIPGIPTVAGLIIVLICMQYVFGARSLWLPSRILRISVRGEHLCAAMSRVRPIARLGDFVARPRMTFLITRTTFTISAIVCAFLAALMPPMEILPLTSSITAFLIAMLALALLARDGTLAIVAITLIAMFLTVGGIII